MQAIILSGGKGTRLYPLTLEVPKPMLPIGGTPLLEYQIRLLKQHGIDEIIFSTGYLHEQIVEYFGDGSKFGVSIQYREDGEKPLGTGGAIKNCADLIKYEDVLVMNGDILTDIDLTKMIEWWDTCRFDWSLMIALAEVDSPQDYGSVIRKFNGVITRFYEKSDKPASNQVNAGIYIMQAESIIDLHLPDGFSMLEETVFPSFAESWSLLGYEHKGYWLDIGTPERYEQAQEDVASKKIIL